MIYDNFASHSLSRSHKQSSLFLRNEVFMPASIIDLVVIPKSRLITSRSVPSLCCPKQSSLSVESLSSVWTARVDYTLRISSACPQDRQ
jgi:hypothetical protein